MKERETFTVGEQVIVDSSRYSERRWSLQSITKITPTGRIKVGFREFNADGSERGGDIYHSCSLLKATPERLAIMADDKARADAMHTVRNANLTKLTTAQLVAIAEIINNIPEETS